MIMVDTSLTACVEAFNFVNFQYSDCDDYVTISDDKGFIDERKYCADNKPMVFRSKRFVSLFSLGLYTLNSRVPSLFI